MPTHRSALVPIELSTKRLCPRPSGMSDPDALSMPQQEAEMLSLFGDGHPHAPDESKRAMDWPPAAWGLAGCGSYVFDLLTEDCWYL